MIISEVTNGTVASTSSTTMSSLSSTTTTESSSTLDMEDFLNLMVAEMQNQDPLEPTDNSTYMAQLATYSQVEATDEMNSTLKEEFAAQLVGKQVVVATDLTSSGTADGTVDYYETISGTTYLSINDKLYDIDDLKAVMEDGYYTEVYNA